MDEKFESKFKEIAARYCSVNAEDIKNDMSFRDDLGLSSLDLMTLRMNLMLNSISVKMRQSLTVLLQ